MVLLVLRENLCPMTILSSCISSSEDPLKKVPLVQRFLKVLQLLLELQQDISKMERKKIDLLKASAYQKLQIKCVSVMMWHICREGNCIYMSVLPSELLL